MVDVAPSLIQTKNRSGLWLSRHRLDAVSLILLFVAASASIGIALAWFTSHAHDPALLDFWFDADCPAIITYGSSRFSAEHWRTGNHPLYPLVVFPAVAVLSRVGGLNALTATGILTALIGGAFASTLYVLFRLMGCRKGDAVLFCLLGLASAAAMFWFSVVETYGLSALSILLGLTSTLLALRSRRVFPFVLIGSILTFSITITNWLVSVAAAALLLERGRAAKVLILTLLLVAPLWSLERLAFPYTGFPGNSPHNHLFLRPHTMAAALEVAPVLLVYPMVMPKVVVGSNSIFGNRPQLTIQKSKIGSGSTVGLISSVLWGFLLALGLWALFERGKLDRRFKAVLGISLLGEVALHILYGRESFLYAANLLAVLLPIAAAGTLTAHRRSVVVMASCLLVGLIINNVHQFQQVVALLARQPKTMARKNDGVLVPAARWDFTHNLASETVRQGARSSFVRIGQLEARLGNQARALPTPLAH